MDQKSTPKKENFSELVEHFRAMYEQLRDLQKVEQQKHLPSGETTLEALALLWRKTFSPLLPVCNICFVLEEIQLRLRKMHRFILSLNICLHSGKENIPTLSQIEASLISLGEIRTLTREIISLSDKERIFDHTWEEAVRLRRTLTRLEASLAKKRSEMLSTTSRHELSHDCPTQ
ncbi:MAG TPA: hypothetical protein PKA31_00025 [Candidatus Moranbacteria bacterium]|nr:hypothetical protein [Candidatus Moranbacteria bacterium]